MTWIWISLLVIGGLIGLLAGVGALLPKNHRASAEVTLKKPPQDVWNVVSNIQEWPAWHANIVRVERLSDHEGHPVWRLLTKDGDLPSEVLEASEPTAAKPGRLVTRIADPAVPFSGSWTIEVSGTEAASRVTVTENGEIRNPIFRFFSRFVFGHTASLVSFLSDLAKKTGDNVKPKVTAE